MSEHAKERPFGLWDSPIDPVEVASLIRLTDVAWDSDGVTLVWREERTGEGVLVCQTAPDSAPRTLSSRYSVQARVGSGGGDFTCGRGQVFFVAEGRIRRRSLGAGKATVLTPPSGECASPELSPSGNHLLYVHSSQGEDVLALVDTEAEHWPVLLHRGHDFYMQPCWHPDGDRLAWISWDHPDMPWDRTLLYLAEFPPEGARSRLEEVRVLAGNEAPPEAVLQPCFSPDGRFLSYISDREGWWNLYLHDLREGTCRRLLDDEAEHGGPAWIQGLRLHAWSHDGRRIFWIRSVGGFQTLECIDVGTGRRSRLEDGLTDYTWFHQIAASPRFDELAVIGSGPSVPTRLLTVTGDGRVRTRRRASSESLPSEFFSLPVALSWKVEGESEGGEGECHGLFYPPRNPDFTFSGTPPGLIRIHGGPTGHAQAQFDLAVQYWTSRGYAVLEVNYRGSTGYGRAYRDALREQWGVLDVLDTLDAARFLASSDRADPSRLALEGGSAGGFTVLLTLAREPGRFRASVCRYPVTDLLTLVSDTHKFERTYLDSLVGSLPRHADRYRRRSPVHHADRIRDPVAIFHGTADQVVPQDQSEALTEVLSRNQVPHLNRVYPGEGHGWRKSETTRDYYLSVERFLRRHLLFAG